MVWRKRLGNGSSNAKKRKSPLVFGYRRSRSRERYGVAEFDAKIGTESAWKEAKVSKSNYAVNWSVLSTKMNVIQKAKSPNRLNRG